MNDVEKAREASPPAPLRAERSAAALVAQYIHELAERHAPARESTGRSTATRRASEMRPVTACPEAA